MAVVLGNFSLKIGYMDVFSRILWDSVPTSDLLGIDIYRELTSSIFGADPRAEVQKESVVAVALFQETIDRD